MFTHTSITGASVTCVIQKEKHRDAGDLQQRAEPAPPDGEITGFLGAEQGPRRQRPACSFGVLRRLQKVLGHAASRGKGMEIPDALTLLEQLNLTGKIVTGDAMFYQKSITAKIVERGGDYILPVKDNQKNLREDIETAFNEPVFLPQSL